MIKFKTHDYIEHKLYVLQLGKQRFSVSISSNWRKYHFTYGRMLDEVLYSVDWFWGFEV